MDVKEIIIALMGSQVVVALLQNWWQGRQRKKDDLGARIDLISAKIDTQGERLDLVEETQSVSVYKVLSDSIKSLLAQGYATAEERRDIANMYDRYKACRWNGDMDSRMKQIYRLPFRQEEKE